ncbi:MAG: methylenetetrahydrofolate--tRNA-(uracil(54)-C(5))-methyltransferase (FADH(2)-oxidizing) TrmFO [Spirochaetes bacterium]|nr:methylenetetrahydrofolate--tRNA-(uracil(54)-C(5))-methyltransferase (FADH(2)-oxidizing) TrmFO [Spirochaetota bacterium]
MIVNIIGAGFAGVEACSFLSKKGFNINLYEMRDKKLTEAHKTKFFAELICSNSFKSLSMTNAHGLLKKEMEELDSLIIKTAYEYRVPAGNSLAVDRDKFARSVTKKIKNLPNVNFVNEEITSLNDFLKKDEFLIIATGPLTSEKLQEEIIKLAGEKSLFFFDAVSPIIDASTINYDIVFPQSRYNKGDSDFLNAPFSKEQYETLVEELKNADKVLPSDFEEKKIFEGCMPVESLALRGVNTLAFGPMKPVGLIDPKTGKEPYAVVQLRCENINKSMYNLVGFQTRMKWHEQKRIIKLIPGLENAEILRYGVIHKNSYLNFPLIADKNLYSIKKNKNIYFAGQITGVEGYIESAASGLFTAYALWSGLNNRTILMPDKTIIGALQKYTLTQNKNYQPMAGNFGLIEREILNKNGKKIKGQDKRQIMAEESISIIKKFFHLHFN